MAPTGQKPHSSVYWAVWFFIACLFSLIFGAFAIQDFLTCDLSDHHDARKVVSMFLSAALSVLFAIDSLGKARRIRRADARFHAENPEPKGDTLSSMFEHPEWTRKRNESRLAAQGRNTEKESLATYELVLFSLIAEIVLIAVIGIRGSGGSAIGTFAVFLIADVLGFCIIFKPWKR